MSNLLRKNDPMFINELPRDPLDLTKAWKWWNYKLWKKLFLNMKRMPLKPPRMLTIQKSKNFSFGVIKPRYTRSSVEQRYTATGLKLHLFLKSIVCV